MRISLLATVGSLAIAGKSNGLPQLVADTNLAIADSSSSQTTLTTTTKATSQRHFRHATFDKHYDPRFAHEPLTSVQRQEELKHLLSSYLSTMSDIGVTTLLSHSTLLGWHRNRHLQPWDQILTTMVPEGSLYHMARYYNMTVHPAPKQTILDPKRDYLLEINPHYQTASPPDPANAIDARWIDIRTGIYIEITTLRRSVDALHRGTESEMLTIKDGSELRFDDVFPLVPAQLEGMVVNVPRAAERILTEEFGAAALVAKTAPGYAFNEAKGLWEPVKI